MIQCRHYPSLALEACRELLLGKLHRNDAVEPRVASLVNLAHTTRAERRKDLVRPEFVAYRKWHMSDVAILADQRPDFAWISRMRDRDDIVGPLSGAYQRPSRRGSVRDEFSSNHRASARGPFPGENSTPSSPCFLVAPRP